MLSVRRSPHPSHLPVISGSQLCCHVILQPLLLPPAYLFLGIPSRQPEHGPPSAEGSLREALAEACYSFAQNLSTIVMLLLRAGLALALLLSFFNLRISLVGYHTLTLIRALRATMERSLIRTWGLCQPMLKVSWLPMRPGRPGAPSSSCSVGRYSFL